MSHRAQKALLETKEGYTYGLGHKANLNKTQVKSMKEEEPGVAVHAPTLRRQRQEDL